jgi:hypothetical protein
MKLNKVESSAGAYEQWKNEKDQLYFSYQQSEHQHMQQQLSEMRTQVSAREQLAKLSFQEWKLRKTQQQSQNNLLTKLNPDTNKQNNNINTIQNTNIQQNQVQHKHSFQPNPSNDFSNFSSGSPRTRTRTRTRSPSRSHSPTKFQSPQHSTCFKSDVKQPAWLEQHTGGARRFYERTRDS